MSPTPTWTPQNNEFLGNVVEKIGRQVYSSKAWTNPLAFFKKGFIDNANEIEEMYIEKFSGVAQDPTGANSKDRVKPNITSQYHKQTFGKLYHGTISDKQTRRAFTTSGGVKRMADKILEQVHTGSNYDEYIAFRDNLKDLYDTQPVGSKIAISGFTYGDESKTRDLVKRIKKHVGMMQFRSTTYSTVENHAEKENLIIISTPDFTSDMDVHLLANAFNMNKANVEQRIVEIDAFPTGMENTICMVVDLNAIQIYDTLYNMEPERNAKGMFTNYFLNVEKIISTSAMYCAVTFDIGV